MIYCQINKFLRNITPYYKFLSYIRECGGEDDVKGSFD